MQHMDRDHRLEEREHRLGREEQPQQDSHLAESEDMGWGCQRSRHVNHVLSLDCDLEPPGVKLATIGILEKHV